jgi:hypothetical protein
MVAMLFTCAFGALVLMPALFYACIRPAAAKAGTGLRRVA